MYVSKNRLFLYKVTYYLQLGIWSKLMFTGAAVYWCVVRYCLALWG